MAFLGAIATAIGSALGGAASSGVSLGSTVGAIGTGISALGAIQQGRAAEAAAEFEAKQLEQKSAEERAAAQREAFMRRREGQLVMSRQQALAAASGAGAGTDAPTIVRLMTETAGAADYGARTSLYGGESRSRSLVAAARGRRASGRASLLGSYGSAFGQAARGFGRAFG